MADNKIENPEMKPEVAVALDNARTNRAANNSFSLDPVGTAKVSTTAPVPADPSASNPEEERKVAEDEKYNQDKANEEKANQDKAYEQDLIAATIEEEELEEEITLDVEEKVLEAEVEEVLESQDQGLEQEPEQQSAPEVKPDEAEEVDFLGLSAINEEPKEEQTEVAALEEQAEGPAPDLDPRLTPLPEEPEPESEKGYESPRPKGPTHI
ncbi:MAG: hypothetical protein P4M12_01145 [Gammaproteobacteria bacterium]|nr:hypothetical protein [Gammaproteobacteria bacterium]